MKFTNFSSKTEHNFFIKMHRQLRAYKITKLGGNVYGQL